ncbi:MOSC domain-containing protein [Oceanospirillum sediminis]|uniref:MOSC domain-containing protein n=1 Tax=Oceanospirillum sediminis TaxID=2760088 RepID=A0A839ILE7_9GAMM|nr:MOSC domain-containing protein [Oceanospirillum sediminis]MBB1486035.1 MOSC domain-containing protein [Oceanospirillum sediminis]
MISEQSVCPLAVFTGKTEQKYGLQTAIDKKTVTGKIYLSETGLEGDECADHKHHGGPERALHQYPAEHYRYWAEKYSEQSHADDWCAPGMGENLSTQGMLENNVCIGDRYQWGEAIIEISQPRSPCFKLNRRWDIDHFSVDMQEISRCGWLYRVIQAGLVSEQDALKLIHRPDNAMTVHQVCAIFFGDPLNRTGLLRLQQQAVLSASWMSKVEQRLEHNTVENWNFRLLGRTE